MVDTVDRRSGSGGKEEEKKPHTEKTEVSSKPDREQPSLPKPDFLQLTQIFFIQTMMALGQAPNPATGKTNIDTDLAKHQIALLELLEQKTKGNLSETEQKYLSECLHQTRLAYVAVAKQRETAKQEQPKTT